MQTNNNHNINNKCRKLKDKIIANYVNNLRNSDYYQIDFKNSFKKCMNKLNERKIERIICYGLGSFSNGIDTSSRYQLALLLLIYEYLNEFEPQHHSQCDLTNKDSVIEIYDPSFDELDKNTLQLFRKPKFNVIIENEYCARRIDCSSENGCTLFYMPHLDKYLYNNLLGANWLQENLMCLLILGNSFREMIDGESSLKSRNELYYLNHLVCNFKESNQKDEYCSFGRRKKRGKPSKMREIHDKSIEDEDDSALVEIEIDDKSFEHSDIFNSFSFQFVNRKWMSNNYKKIEQYCLTDWTYVTSQPIDDLI